LGAILGLSEREADLGVALVRCPSLPQAAADCGMAFNTARNHLQSIFRKSGTSSQAEAVQLFSRLG
jgi:DNA-binding NarL/FixJ family response regulator